MQGDVLARRRCGADFAGVGWKADEIAVGFGLLNSEGRRQVWICVDGWGREFSIDRSGQIEYNVLKHKVQLRRGVKHGHHHQ